MLPILSGPYGTGFRPGETADEIIRNPWPRWVKQPPMVESGKSSPNEELRDAIDQALQSGVDEKAIAQMVAERALTLNDVARNGLAVETPPENAGDVIYEPGGLPEGLIDLPSAAKKYGIKPATLRMWVQRGRLPRRGRLRGPSPGRGYIVAAIADIEYCRDNPRKPWHNKSVTS